MSKISFAFDATEKKCSRCRGTGKIQVAQGPSGIITCPKCDGTGKVKAQDAALATDPPVSRPQQKMMCAVAHGGSTHSDIPKSVGKEFCKPVVKDAASTNYRGFVIKGPDKGLEIYSNGRVYVGRKFDNPEEARRFIDQNLSHHGAGADVEPSHTSPASDYEAELTHRAMSRGQDAVFEKDNRCEHCMSGWQHTPEQHQKSIASHKTVINKEKAHQSIQRGIVSRLQNR